MSSYEKFAKDTLIIGIANTLVALSKIIFLPILTKTLGTYDYGIWAQVRVTVGLVLGVVGLGLPYALTRFLPAKTQKEEIREEFWSVFCLTFLATFVVSLILFAAAGPIARAFFEGSTEIVRITGLIILTWSLDTTLLSVFRAFRQMKRYALFVVGDAYIELALITFLILKGYGLISIVWCMLGVRGATLIPLFLLINSQLKLKKPHFSNIKEYLSFGLPTIPGNLASWVVASSDRYVIGYYLGATSVGIYSAVHSLGSLMIMLAGILGFVLPPTLSKLYDEGKINEVKTHLKYSLKYLLALNIPFVFGAIVLSKPTLRLLSTAEIASQGYIIVFIMGLSALLYSTYVVISHVLVLAKKTRITGFIWIAAATANLGLNILVVPCLGIFGAALTTLIAYLIALSMTSYYSVKEFKFEIDWLFIGKSVVASAIMTLVIWPMYPQSNIATVIAILVSIAVYAAVLLLLKGFKKEELAFFQRLIRRNASNESK